jgi:mono/diheme cytochrome c family protein
VSWRLPMALAVTALAISACGPSDGPEASREGQGASASATAPPSQGGPGLGDPARGQQVWLAQCVACHNLDPGKDGAVGPAVKGATLALLEARVVHGTYPDGYRPKRDTRVMPPRRDLAASVPDLAAYLR